MSLPDLLAACSSEPGLPFLLIGGHAVIAYGYSRTTFDVDFLVRQEQLPAWSVKLAGLGYRSARQQGAFAQFTPPPGLLDLDLMSVNEATFDGLWHSSRELTIRGQAVRIPSLDHLLALKLHVLKQALPHRAIKDLNDVIELVLANRLDIRNAHYRALFERYGNLRDYQKVIHATQNP